MTDSFVPAAYLASSSGGASMPLALLLVFGAARLFDEVFERLHQPGIVGQILAGVLIGPSVLGWIAPSEFLSALGELGVMFLLFRVGLEVKSSELLKVGGTALAVAALGVAVPFVCGWGLLRLWGAPQVESIFVGAAMVATSVGITAQVLAAGGLLQQQASRIILAAAVIDDVLGLLVLALVSSLAKGSINPLELTLTGVLAIAFTLLVAHWGAKTMLHLIPRMLSAVRAAEAEFALAMILLFALAALAEKAGVAAIIGAFLAGMALSESVEQRVHDLTQGVTQLLVPFFLAGIGLHFDLKAFSNRGTLLLAFVIVIAAIVSKFLACGLGAIRLGWKTAAKIGVGMVPRGEVGMVVAQIGLSLGVIAVQVHAVVVFMAVATTLAAPPLLRLAFRERPGPGASL